MKKIILIIIMMIMVSTVLAKVDKSVFNIIKEKIPALSQEQVSELKSLLGLIDEEKIETKGFDNWPMGERVLTLALKPHASKISLITYHFGDKKIKILLKNGRLLIRNISGWDEEKIKKTLVPEIKKMIKK